MAASGFQLEGGERLLAELDRLDTRTRGNIKRKMLRRGASPIRKLARSFAPVGATNKLKRSVITVVKASGASAQGDARIGPQRGPQVGIGVMHEDGTPPRYTKGKGKYTKPAYRGALRALRWMSRAFIQGEQKALSEMARTATEELMQKR